MVVNWLRDRWFYASLVSLRTQPMSPSELLERFESLHADSVQIFGPHSIYPERVTRRLATLVVGGLLERGPQQGRRREYSVTPLGLELLDSIGDATAYAQARYEMLVRYSRTQQRMDPCLAPLYLRPDSEATVEQIRRRSTALLFGTVLGPKWTFSTLAALSWGSLHFTQIIEVVNRSVASSPDVVTGHLVDSVLVSRLAELQLLGLAVRMPAKRGLRDVYTLTSDGRALIVVLEPVAQFGMRRDAEMTASIGAM